MKAMDLIRWALQQSDEGINAIVQDMRGDAALTQPTEQGGNHPLWVIGHLAFIEGVVTYANDAKTRTLGVEPMLLLEHGAVSAPVAEAMAEGIRKRAGTDFGLSITGIAGPSGGSEEKPVGTVFIALAGDVKTEHRKLHLPGDRQLIRWRASQAALDLLRRRLL